MGVTVVQVGAADRRNERTAWKRGEYLSFTHGTPLYASHACRVLGFQEVYDQSTDFELSVLGRTTRHLPVLDLCDRQHCTKMKDELIQYIIS
jgi:hypothetical protein